jgi:hypothetical protein
MRRVRYTIVKGCPAFVQRYTSVRIFRFLEYWGSYDHSACNQYTWKEVLCGAYTQCNLKFCTFLPRLHWTFFPVSLAHAENKLNVVRCKYKLNYSSAHAEYKLN